jgi:hypothetical protein
MMYGRFFYRSCHIFYYLLINIFCEDSACERNERLFSNSRAPPIYCKDKTFIRVKQENPGFFAKSFGVSNKNIPLQQHTHPTFR